MNEIDTDSIKLAGADDEVLEVYRLLKKYKEDTDRVWWVDEVYNRGWEIAYGKSDSLWTTDEKEAMKKKGQIPISINDLHKGIQGSSAVATANKPGINVAPIGSGDLYVAELLKRGFDFVWGQNVGNFVIYDVVKEAKTGSMGWIDVKFDPTKGEFGKIVFESDNPLDYYWDKKSRKPDKSDSHIIKAHLITRTYAKENYEVTDEDLDFKPITTDEQEGTSSAGKPGEDEYARMEAEKKRDSDGSTLAEDVADIWEIEAWLIKKERERKLSIIRPDGSIENVYLHNDKEAEEAIAKLPKGFTHKLHEPRRVEIREQRVVVGKKLISTEKNPFGLDSDGDPVVPKIPLIHDRAFNGMAVSPTYRGIEISRSRNKRRMQTIYVVSKNIDAPIVRTEDSKWVKDDVHGDELIVGRNVTWEPRRLLPGTNSADLAAMEQRDEAALNEEFDMHDVMKGKLPPGVDSGRLVLALQDQAGMMSGPFIGAVEWVVEKLAKVLLALMLRHWPRKWWERLIEPDEMETWVPDKEKTQQLAQQQPAEMGMGMEQPQQSPDQGQQDQQKQEIREKWSRALELIRPEDTEKPPGIELEGLDVKIIAGSTMPTNRMAKQEVAIEMVKGGLYDAQAGLDYVDDPKKDEIVARMEMQRKQELQAIAQGEAVKGKK